MRSPLVRISNIVLLFLFATSAQRAEAFFLPDTGQTICYSNKGTGKVIACPAPGNALAQDGSYTINPPSFTIVGDGTVLDNNTWLMWQQQDDGVGRLIKNAESYCENLELAGHSDWRLPTKKELLSIFDYGKSTLAIDTAIFPNAKYGYISSTVALPADGNNWGVYLEPDGWLHDYYEGKDYYGSNTQYSGSGYVRCVRGRRLNVGSFTNNGNGTVTDTATSLMWQQGEGGTMDWGTALAYCEALTLGGYSDWRLPNIRELEAFADDTRVNPAINTALFPGVTESSSSPLPGLYYWSSTPNAALPDNRWSVSFSMGYTVSPVKSEKDKSVRCVRGQPAGLLDPQEISATPDIVDFWYVPVSESRTFTFTVSNAYSGSLIINSVTPPAAPFSVVSDQCSGSALPGLSSCTITLGFTSSSEGTFSDALVISSNDADHPNLTVTIKARANARGSAFLLPDSGQAACYDGDGYSITCPAEGQSLAQDGSYATNMPSYTVNTDGTVTDDNTGLMWQREDDSTPRTWADAVNYCESSMLGGYTDWRLPDKKELFTLVHYGYWNEGDPAISDDSTPTIDPAAFPNTSLSAYWSSTVSARSNDGAWAVSFDPYLYLMAINGKSSTLLTRCVRGEHLPSNILQDNGNDTISDLATGLMWQKKNNGYKTWDVALGYCEALSHGGYTDWRMPNIRELASLIDDTRYNPALDMNFFSLDYKGDYWTSTTLKHTTDIFPNIYHDAHTINLYGGRDSYFYKKTTAFTAPDLICVRGGNIMPPPALAGTVTDSYTGLPLTNVAVSVTDSLNSVYTTATGTDGKYTITPLATGAFTAVFTKTGYISYTGNGTIASDHKTTFNVQMSSIPPLSVTILTPQAGAILNASPVIVTGTVTNNAQVTVNSVPAVVSAGTFTASVGLTEGSNTLTAAASDSYSQTASHSITVTLITKGAITGAVTDSATGQAVASAKVTVTDSLSIVKTVYTDANGNYTIADVTQGNYSGTVSAQDYAIYSFTGTLTAGQTAPVNAVLTLVPPAISTVAAGNITGYTAIITWTTDQPSSSVVSFGTTTEYGSSAADPALTTNHSIALADLVPGTLYYFRVTSANSHSLSSSSADSTFTTVDYPLISAISMSNVAATSATITWTTDQAADSLVSYGTTTAYESTMSDPTLTTAHSMTLANLTLGTMYHFKVSATNSFSLTSSSSDSTLTTVGYPVITGVIVSNVTTTSATIMWTTDQASDSLVSYGTTTAYGSTTGDATMTTNHSISLTGLALQTEYHFTVTSTNAYGLSSTSADNTFTTRSPISVMITSPSSGATIQRPDIMVKGTITNSTGNETGVVVNSVVATVYGDTFMANHVPVSEGSNTITVTATDTAGYTATASITVTAAAGNYITLSSNIDSGISPLEPTLRIDGYASGTTPSISYIGPGSVDWTTCTSFETCKVKMTTEGVYYFTATGTGSDGNTYQDTMSVTVYSRTEMDTLLKAKWDGMKNAMSAGNVEEAVSYFAQTSKASVMSRN